MKCSRFQSLSETHRKFCKFTLRNRSTTNWCHNSILTSPSTFSHSQDNNKAQNKTWIFQEALTADSSEARRLKDFFGIIDMKLKVISYRNCWQLVSVEFIFPSSSPCGLPNGKSLHLESQSHESWNNKIWWRSSFSSSVTTVCRLKYYCSASSAFRNNFASLSSNTTKRNLLDNGTLSLLCECWNCVYL